MKQSLIYWIQNAASALSYSKYMMLWNLFLAIIPLLISIWIFRWSRKRSFFWWLLFLVFFAFLPNAPYVLTDTIHLIELIRMNYSVWIITLVIIPQYLLFLTAGVQFYTISIMNLSHYLSSEGYKKYVLTVEILTHFLCAIGIYLGRFKRFNSWDFVTQPNHLFKSVVNDLTQKQPTLVIILTFIILVAVYWLVKQLNLAIVFKLNYHRYIRQQINPKRR